MRGRKKRKSRKPEPFSPDWLALREPADHRSRAAPLVERLQAEWRARGWTRIVDLGSGTGSNLRYLAPRLPGPQHWTLVDHDAALLARVEPVVPDDPREAAKAPALEVRCVQGDLGDAGLRAIADADLVTCSALLDLVDVDWIERLVLACLKVGCGAYLALTYDGVMQWSPPGEEAPDADPDDALIRDAIKFHQQRHEALGPAAAHAAAVVFDGARYRIWRQPSPWRLGPQDRALALALIDGWERAALELLPAFGSAPRIHAWAERRRETASGDRFHLTVGHQDVLALPGDRARRR